MRNRASVCRHEENNIGMKAKKAIMALRNNIKRAAWRGARRSRFRQRNMAHQNGIIGGAGSGGIWHGAVRWQPAHMRIAPKALKMARAARLSSSAHL
jgi:hypothetical protein